MNRIEEFKNKKLGMFVHFGLYSIVGKGEWYMHNENIQPKEYEKFMHKFKVDKNWARKLVRVAKSFGAKYIVLTTRHHDGFSLYDTKDLSDYNVLYTPTKRDIVKEFVDECNKNSITPFFYHTIIDWHDKRFRGNPPAYFDYLCKSIELLCKNYGKIGGFWFDGTWSDANLNWHLDEIFEIVRKWQPQAIISNNGGLEHLGQIIHPEVDCMVYEKGSPSQDKKSVDDKQRAKEVCQTLNKHWGYSKTDKNYKSASELKIIYDECMRNNTNLLLNVGPKKNGLVSNKEKRLLKQFYKKISK